ncbi:MAG: hypothetical protein P8K68_13540 [Algibacter sp.]|uniref:hypothetical protein n=1 Tax=Algibacter sp. TaxID=1872428 RepID=UPI00262EFA42|nr:hypothetical protein [Algibacter sp.]MDG1728846.1 hypothetical protein [Algibacter sp.]MDG2179789.1 hypothetical protein [Algibacter sp.]
MKREIRIYILKGVKIDLENQSKSEYNSLIKVHAFYTNLKELYDSFDSDTIQSYSTVASHIQKDGFYRIRDGKYRYGESFESFNEITITRALANRIYHKRTSISLSDLILKEASRISEDGFTVFK